MTDRIDIVMGMMARCDWLTAGDARFIIDNGIDFDAVLRFIGR